MASHWLVNLPVAHQQRWSAAAPGPAAGEPATVTAGASVVADVLIIGGGITGTALALNLRQLAPQLKVTLVEARGISHGATGRNGGLMWPSLNTPWPDTVQQYGAAQAKKLMDFEMQCFQEITGWITSNGLQESLQFSLFPEGGLTLCETQGELQAELADLQAQKLAGVEPLMAPVHPTTAEKLGHHAFVGCLQQQQVGRVTAARLAHALLYTAADIAPADRLKVLTHTRVTNLCRTALGLYTVTTESQTPGDTVKSNQCTLLARAVVHATNGYNQLLPALRERQWLVPVRNQVAVTAPLPADHPMPDASYYARQGFVYFSRRSDHRVVIGGFRDVTSHKEWGTTDDSASGLDPVVSACLRAYLPAALPSLFAVERVHLPAEVATTTADASRGAGASLRPHPLRFELEWSGILGFTKDRWPLVGLLPPDVAAAQPAIAMATDSQAGSAPAHGVLSGEYACMGFSGHGMTRAYTCARNLALMMLGRQCDPSFPSSVFTPARVSAGAVSKL